MKYFHLLGDKKQMLETFAKAHDLQLQNKFVEDFAVLRSACQDIARPLLQSSEDEDALSETCAWIEQLGILYRELSVAHEEHIRRVQDLKEQIQDALW